MHVAINWMQTYPDFSNVSAAAVPIPRQLTISFEITQSLLLDGTKEYSDNIRR
jgi:hypothetical protein